MSDDLTTDVVSHRSQPVVVSVLRWVAVLPAAVGAFFGIQLFLILVNAMTEAR